MTDHFSASTARTKRKQGETAPRTRDQRTARQKKFDRDLAALQELLDDDLQASQSPPLAANDDTGGQSQTPELESPKARLKPPPRSRPAAKKSGEPRRARRAPPPAENYNDQPAPARESEPWLRAFEADLLKEGEARSLRAHPYDLDAFTDREPFEAVPEPAWERRPIPGRRYDDRAPLYTKPRPEQHAVARALRIGATVFSVLALVGVSALLVLLAAGGNRSMTQNATSLPASAKQTAANESAAPAALPVENDDVLVTGSARAPRDNSRIASEGEPMHVIRGGGTVRAVAPGETVAQPQQVAENAPVLAAPDANADRSVLSNEPPATPQAETPAPAAAPAEPPAQVASIDDARPAEPHAGIRTAPVTTHVNMRASPDNDGKVVAVVPAGKDVEVVECKQWCEVSYNDQQGYIHKRFLKE